MSSGRMPSAVAPRGRAGGGELRAELEPLVAEHEAAHRAVDRALEHVHRRIADERRHEAVGGAVVDLVRRRELLQLAVAHDGHEVGHRHRLGLVVRDVQRGRPEALLQALDLAAHRRAQLRVEVRERLVHQEHGRLAHDRARQGDALALAAREVARPAVEQVRDLERLGDALHARALVGLAEAADAQRVGDVLGDGHVRVERVALEHHRDVAVARLHARHVAVADVHRARGRQLEARRARAAPSSCRSPRGRAARGTRRRARRGRASAAPATAGRSASPRRGS